MGTSMFSIKTVLLGIAMLTIIAFIPGSAKADEVTIGGYTNGCFNCNPPPVPNTSAVQTASLGGLTYVNSQFSGTTAADFLGLGGIRRYLRPKVLIIWVHSAWTRPHLRMPATHLPCV